ncbi:hypothetical protein HVY60_12895 [Citrobacter freundii]|nr:hypothetical protein HVY60_12895 [Citrobacter freundii]
MGFPSPASDYVETRISLDQQLISQPAATYFMWASHSHFREGIIQGALPEDGDGYNSSHTIFGVITYIINDARNAEFDDCPVM